MLERVAVAICKSRTCEGIHCCQWPANGARINDCPVQRGAYNDAARDAIAAMREPTDAMVDAGAGAQTSGRREGVPLAWRAMIDEALAE
jgi:hypothetical protein